MDEADDVVTMVRGFCSSMMASIFFLQFCIDSICCQVRVSGDDIEDLRRSTSENMRLERRRRLLAEAELSAKVDSLLYRNILP
jgi:hypothetical protein